jgi:hypothetical protein
MAGCFVVLSAAAHARPLDVSFEPSMPTWQEPVRLRVSGVTSCVVAPSLENLRRTATGVDVELVGMTCFEPRPTPVPFVAEIDLGHLPTGVMEVRVHDVADGSVAEVDLPVHAATRLVLELPALATSDEPVRLAVVTRDRCVYLDHQVDGMVIRLNYVVSCNITPLGPELIREELDLGRLAPGDYDVQLRDLTGWLDPDTTPLLRRSLRVWRAEGCLPGQESLCLHRGRFRLTGTWRAFDGSVGTANAAPLVGNEGSGQLWFFAATNAELTAKVLDGCAVNGRWWAFLSSASTVEYEITITDTKSGASRTYRNELGQVPRLVADTGAFSCS